MMGWPFLSSADLSIVFNTFPGILLHLTPPDNALILPDKVVLFYKFSTSIS